MLEPIIIPTKNPNNLRACLKALAAAEELAKHQLIVVTNGNQASIRATIRGVFEPLGRLSVGAGWQMIPYLSEPFNYSRAINMGLRELPRDSGVFLMNDDALLETRYGLTRMETLMAARGQMAILSPRIIGVAAGASQTAVSSPRATDGLLEEPFFLAFVCVLIGSTVLREVGFLDEAFTGYGQEDVDYCLRAKRKGCELLTTTKVVVRHDGTLPSTYRNLPNIKELSDESIKIFQARVGKLPWA